MMRTKFALSSRVVFFLVSAAAIIAAGSSAPYLAAGSSSPPPLSRARPLVIAISPKSLDNQIGRAHV